MQLQAPLLVSKTVEEGQLWMSALKRIVAAVSPVGRVAWTGSAMVTFLNHVRMLPTNGFRLMVHVRFVQLGGTPSVGAATAMAAALGRAYADAKAWPDRVQQLLGTDAIVQKLQATATGGLLSARPALVSHVLGLMGDARRGSADAVLDAAVSEAQSKLRAESRSDFTTALGHLEMSADIKQGLFELGKGDQRRLDELQLGDMVTKMFSLLCEPSVGSKQRLLLPPYAAFIKECLNEDGDVIVRWAGNKDELGDKLRGILNFHAEAYTDFQLHSVHQAAVSAAVLKSFLANGIGVKDSGNGTIRAVCSASDVSKVPALHALLQDSANSRLAEEHARKLLDPKALPRYNASIGLHVLRWVRNAASHCSWAAAVLTAKGLSVPVLDAAARAAATALCDVREHAGFAFRLGEKGIPKRVQVAGSGMHLQRPRSAARRP